MITSSMMPVMSTIAMIEQPSSDHPAYWPLFADYQRSGQSATHALVLLARNWDEEVQGPLPSTRTARHRAQVDAWDAKVEETVAATVVRYDANIGMLLLRAGS